MSKMKALVKEAEEKGSGPFLTKTGDISFHVCCDCNLRHVVKYRVIRGKKPKDDMIELEYIRDEMGTEAMRYYEKRQKK